MKSHLPVRVQTAQDIQAILLAHLGFSRSTICSRTGLSAGEVSYRLKRAGVSVRDYRNGQTELAHKMIAYSTKESAHFFAALKGDIQKLLEARTHDVHELTVNGS